MTQRCNADVNDTFRSRMEFSDSEIVVHYHYENESTGAYLLFNFVSLLLILSITVLKDEKYAIFDFEKPN